MEKTAFAEKEKNKAAPVRYKKTQHGIMVVFQNKKNHPYYPEVKMPEQAHGYIKCKRNDCL